MLWLVAQLTVSSLSAGGLEAKSQDWKEDAIGWQGLTSRAGGKKWHPQLYTNNTAQSDCSLIVYVCTCSLGAWKSSIQAPYDQLK